MLKVAKNNIGIAIESQANSAFFFIVEEEDNSDYYPTFNTEAFERDDIIDNEYDVILLITHHL